MEDLSREGRQVQSECCDLLEAERVAEGGPSRACRAPARRPRTLGPGRGVDSEQDVKPTGDSEWMREMIKCSSLECSSESHLGHGCKC